MISYYSKNKKYLSTCEDLLSAITFDGLKYLPIEIFYRILKNSLVHDKLPYHSGELQSISYWDNWDATGTKNSTRVIPDVFLRFYEFDIIVEAKRNDEKQQYFRQQENEIISYYNEYGDDKKQLYFIQLGGLHNFDNELDYNHGNNNVIICKTNWTKLLHQIVKERDSFNQMNLSMFNSYIRILDDIILGFELHNFYQINWLKGLNSPKIINQIFRFKSSFKLSQMKKILNLKTHKITSQSTNNMFNYAK